MISPANRFAWGAAVVTAVVTEVSDWSEQPAMNTAAMTRRQRNDSKPEVHMHTCIFGGHLYKIFYPGKIGFPAAMPQRDKNDRIISCHISKAGIILRVGSRPGQLRGNSIVTKCRERYLWIPTVPAVAIAAAQTQGSIGEIPAGGILLENKNAMHPVTAILVA